MYELLKEILSNFGVPGVIISIILIILRTRPITLLSASPIEMKLATKEKRFYIRALRSLSEILIYLLALLTITDYFFSNDKYYYPVLSGLLTFVVVGVLIGILILDLFNKSILDLIKDFSKGKQMFIYLLFLVYIVICFLLPAYYIGTQVYSNIYSEELTRTEQIGAFVALALFYFVFIIAIYGPVIKTIYRFLGFNKNIFQNLVVKKNNKTWFIFHPIDKELFLLGNKSTINNCSEFIFIERAELYKEEILVKEIDVD
ncbi:hypothetical protein ACQCVP_19195 [Rossellomorea vietnamensis]|uniref:hypothetical protein n=1 Tax=Rossellomorea vietnamensis TaxID=218284 RepID=UPI003CF12E18